MSSVTMTTVGTTTATTAQAMITSLAVLSLNASTPAPMATNTSASATPTDPLPDAESVAASLHAAAVADGPNLILAFVILGVILISGLIGAVFMFRNIDVLVAFFDWRDDLRDDFCEWVEEWRIWRCFRRKDDGEEKEANDADVDLEANKQEGEGSDNDRASQREGTIRDDGSSFKSASRLDIKFSDWMWEKSRQNGKGAYEPVE